MRKTTTLLLATLVLGTALQARAADEDGRFGIEGIGGSPCSEFSAAAKDRNSRNFAVYAGWIMGYVSQANRLTEDTFDLTPWQPVEVLIHQLTRYCAGNPTASFEQANAELLAFLMPQRMVEADTLMTFRSGTKATMIYESVLTTLAANLKAAGYENDGDPVSVSRAIKAFQEAQNLPVNGLPDVNVLARLVSGG